tara:strand:- start:5063 stop:5749 length:687 start_codon:yes stop_codon:yes gene_type:complete
MKSIITLALTLSTIILSAQTYSIIESTVYHEKKSQLSLEVDIAPSPKDTRKAFQKYLKSNHDVKLKRSGDFYAVEAKKITDITDVQIDLFAKFKEDKNNGTQMSLFARKGYDLYITPKEDAKAFASMRAVFETFLKEYLTKYYEDQLKDAVGVHADLSKDKKKLEKDIEDLKEDIEDNKKEIKSLSKENDDNEKEQKEKTKELKELEDKISGAGNKLDNLKTKKQEIK